MRDGLFRNVYPDLFADDLDGFILVEREPVIKAIALKMYATVLFTAFMFNFVDAW